MLNFSAATGVFVALDPVDLRRSFNGLFGCVQQQLQLDPLSGHLFVFPNRARNRLKILVWGGCGLWVCAKRLERGRFSWPRGSGRVASLHAEERLALISGLEVRAKQNGFRRDASEATTR